MISEKNLNAALVNGPLVVRDAFIAAGTMRNRDRLEEALEFLRRLRDVASYLVEKRLSIENAPNFLEALDRLEAEPAPEVPDSMEEMKS